MTKKLSPKRLGSSASPDIYLSPDCWAWTLIWRTVIGLLLSRALFQYWLTHQRYPITHETLRTEPSLNSETAMQAASQAFWEWTLDADTSSGHFLKLSKQNGFFLENDAFLCFRCYLSLFASIPIRCTVFLQHARPDARHGVGHKAVQMVSSLTLLDDRTSKEWICFWQRERFMTVRVKIGIATLIRFADTSQANVEMFYVKGGFPILQAYIQQSDTIWSKSVQALKDMTCHSSKHCESVVTAWSTQPAFCSCLRTNTQTKHYTWLSCTHQHLFFRTVKTARRCLVLCSYKTWAAVQNGMSHFNAVAVRRGTCKKSACGENWEMI